MVYTLFTPFLPLFSLFFTYFLFLVTNVTNVTQGYTINLHKGTSINHFDVTFLLQNVTFILSYFILEM